MRNLFALLLSAAVLFASCAKIEDITVRSTNDNGKEIVFNTKASTSTKAIVEGTEMVDNFGVYGWLESSEAYLLSNAEYDANGDAANDKTYYWPVSDNGIDVIFTAYSQFDGEASLDAEGNVTIVIPTLTQELINNDADFDDVLWAQTKTTHASNSGRVNLEFKHALSWLQFRAEVEESIKWVDIKSVKFGAYTEGQEAVEAVEAQEEYDEITDTWVNLKRSSSAVGSATKLKGPGESAYTNAAALPDELVAEIKSYYSINNGDPGDYDLHMGASVWPSNELRALRVVKEIPAEYKITVEMRGGEIMDFFDGWKYLQDNGYDIQPANTGGKPAVWDYILIDAFVNGAAYTVVGLNFSDSNAEPQHTTVHHDAVPGVEGQEAIPAGFLAEGIYVDGSLVLPTKDTLTTAPIATYVEQKDTTLNHCSQVWNVEGGNNQILGNALVIPQAVPTNITIVFDVCIENNEGEEVIIADRSVTRTINAGNDMQDVAYANNWEAANKYIYNFKFGADIINFNVSVIPWVSTNNEYHVWDY